MLASRWATLGAVPIAAIGALYYAVASGLAWTPPAAWRRPVAWVLVALTGMAFVVTTVLFYLQAAVIHSWCRFCLVSAALTTALFVCALVLLKAAPGFDSPGTTE